MAWLAKAAPSKAIHHDLTLEQHSGFHRAADRRPCQRVAIARWRAGPVTDDEVSTAPAAGGAATTYCCW